MSANLSKYELLQHRHLGLLRALDDAGVKVTNVQGKPWQVELPVAFRTRVSDLPPGAVEFIDTSPRGFRSRFFHNVKHEPPGFIPIYPGPCKWVGADVKLDTLLTALKDNDIKVAFDSINCKWNVKVLNAWRTSSCSMRFDNQQNFAGFPQFDSRCFVNEAEAAQRKLHTKNYPNVPNQHAETNWQIRVLVEGGKCYGTIGNDGGSQRYTVEYSPTLFHLLSALRAAILAAPAKA